MKKFRFVSFAFLLLASSIATAQAPGLEAEAVIRTDDATVRRVHDHKNGVLCYVVSHYAYAVAPHGITVAISCLPEPERKP